MIGWVAILPANRNSHDIGKAECYGLRMSSARNLRRVLLLALTVLSACAASDPGPMSRGRGDRFAPTGAFGNYLAGRFALQRTDMTTACNDLLKAQAAAPDDPEVTTQAFVACLNTGRPEATTLARRLPDNPVAQLLLANVDAKAGRWKATERRVAGLPRQGVTQVLQPLLLAWSLQADGRPDEALAVLRPFIDVQRSRPTFSLHAALIADAANRRDDADKYYRIARAEFGSSSVRVAQILASWQARSGHPAEAQATLAGLAGTSNDAQIALPALLQSVTSKPVTSPTDGMAEAYMAFASALTSQNANDLSIVMLRLALDLRPDLTAARLAASEIMVAQRHPEAALAMLSAVPSQDPLSAVVRLRRVALQDRTGKTDAALSDLRQMSADYPDSPLPELQLGDLYRTKQRHTEAIAAYDRAIARVARPGRNDWVMYYSRGISLERSNQWPKAEADFLFALSLAPEQPLVLNYLGYSWADKGLNLDRARDMLQKAAQRRPDDGSIIDSLGWVLFRQGAIQEAVKTLERAVELEPDDPTINGHLGDAYWAVGRKIEAQYQWRRALTLNPPPDDVAKLEAKLNPAGGAQPGGGPAGGSVAAGQ